MKNKRKRRIKAVLPAKNLIAWPVLLLLSVIFTQALHNTITYAFLYAVLAMPLVSLVYVIAAMLSVRSMAAAQSAEAVKNFPLNYYIRVSNKSILPFPMVSAEFILPAGGAGKSTALREKFSLMPLSSYKKSETVSFSCKGQYAVGVESISVYDLFGFFRVVISPGSIVSITVLPQTGLNPAMPDFVSYGDASVNLTKGNGDLTELSEISEYKPQDPKKSIHWKISFKMDQLMSRKYLDGVDISVRLICNTQPRLPFDKDRPFANEYAADMAADVAASLLYKCVSEGAAANILFPDIREKGGVYQKAVLSDGEFDQALRCLALCPVNGPGYKSCIESVENEGPVVFVTPEINCEITDAICKTASLTENTVSVYLCRGSAFTAASEEKEKEYSAYIDALILSGADVIITDSDL